VSGQGGFSIVLIVPFVGLVERLFGLWQIVKSLQADKPGFS
jgi:hypothetical protein